MKDVINKFEEDFSEIMTKIGFKKKGKNKWLVHIRTGIIVFHFRRHTLGYACFIDIGLYIDSLKISDYTFKELDFHFSSGLGMYDKKFQLIDETNQEDFFEIEQLIINLVISDLKKISSRDILIAFPNHILFRKISGYNSQILQKLEKRKIADY